MGSPIAYSRSPILHRAAYAVLGLTSWTYDRVDLQAGELGDWLSQLDDSWRGVSVTMPLKQEASACADTASELVANLGAANTLVRHQSGWHADNTDVAGLLGALNEARTPTRTSISSATVVGAGGTAAAAVAALARLGQSHVDVVVREAARAQDLLTVAQRLDMTAELHRWPGTSSGESHISDQTDRTVSGESALAADLVISTVPAAATSGLLDHGWHERQIVIDVTYDPWPTDLMTAASAHGATAIGGASVLLWQAAAQVELMTGQAAPVDAMRAALLPGGNLAPA